MLASRVGTMKSNKVSQWEKGLSRDLSIFLLEVMVEDWLKDFSSKLRWRLKPPSVSALTLEISAQDRNWDLQNLDLWLIKHKNDRPFLPLLGHQSAFFGSWGLINITSSASIVGAWVQVSAPPPGLCLTQHSRKNQNFENLSWLKRNKSQIIFIIEW